MYRSLKYSFYNQSRSLACKFIFVAIVLVILKYGIGSFNLKSLAPRFDLIRPYQEETPEPNGSREHRPAIHFSPQANWINDPNGLVYYDGEWHLFFQHYPQEPTHKNTHWGHAVSTDLITWTELPIAIKPDDNEAGIWSGSVVVDWKNITGFQTETIVHAMIAIYTWHKSGQQEQHMAYSLDRGRTWTKYSANPIVAANVTTTEPNTENQTPTTYVFRDPKVLFHAATSSWIFVVSGGDHIQFYKSSDLTHWTLTSRFGYKHGSHGGTWECPDLIDVSSATASRTNLWILIVSVQNNASAGGSGMQYFIGTFDGINFENVQTRQTVNWLDYGPDFYAGITFHNIPQYDGRQIMISWMNNWQYAKDLPTAPGWRGQMTIPRQLKLEYNSFTNAYHLRQTPVHELYSYSKKLVTFHRQILTTDILADLSGDVFMLTSEFHNIKKTTVIRLRVKQNSAKTEYTEVKYSGETNQVIFDRSSSGNVDFHADFIKKFNMVLDSETLKTRIFKLQVIVDRCSVEVFVNGGKYTMTGLIFPSPKSNQMELVVEGEEVTLNYMELMHL